jgi:hypothetical protein
MAVILMLVTALATAPAAADLSGKWQLELNIGGNTGSPTIDIKQEGEKITGVYSGRFGESKLEGTVKDNKIEFRVKINAEGNELTVVYSGTVEANGTLKGKASFGDFGEGDWTGKRAAAK